MSYLFVIIKLGYVATATDNNRVASKPATCAYVALRSRPAAWQLADVGKRGEERVGARDRQARSAHVRDVSKITAQVGDQLACSVTDRVISITRLVPSAPFFFSLFYYFLHLSAVSWAIWLMGRSHL